eukprot:3307381-Rhodomonas_salina.1
MGGQEQCKIARSEAQHRRPSSLAKYARDSDLCFFQLFSQSNQQSMWWHPCRPRSSLPHLPSLFL